MQFYYFPLHLFYSVFLFILLFFDMIFTTCLNGVAALYGEKFEIFYKVRWGHFFEISLIPQIKITENLLTFYSLESPTEEQGNVNERLVITRSKSKFVGVNLLGILKGKKTRKFWYNQIIRGNNSGENQDKCRRKAKAWRVLQSWGDWKCHSRKLCPLVVAQRWKTKRFKKKIIYLNLRKGLRDGL